jgi:hypothetical protein
LSIVKVAGLFLLVAIGACTNRGARVTPPIDSAPPSAPATSSESAPTAVVADAPVAQKLDDEPLGDDGCMNPIAPDTATDAPTTLPAHAGRIPVVELPPSFESSGWRNAYLGDCSLEWGGLKAVATDDALYVTLFYEQNGEIRLMLEHDAGSKRQRLRWRIPTRDSLNLRAEPEGGAPPLAVQSIVRADSTLAIRIARVAGFERVAMAYANGMQGWATGCGADYKAHVGWFGGSNLVCGVTKGVLGPTLTPTTTP